MPRGEAFLFRRCDFKPLMRVEVSLAALHRHLECCQIGIVFPLQAVPQRPGRPGRADLVFSHGISGPMDGVGTFLSRGQVDAWVIGGTSPNSVRQEPSPACYRTKALHSGRRVRETGCTRGGRGRCSYARGSHTFQGPPRSRRRSTYASFGRGHHPSQRGVEPAAVRRGAYSGFIGNP